MLNKDKFYYFGDSSHIACRLPKEAYYYFPKESEIIEYDEKYQYKTLRRIFEGGLEYNSFEKTKLKELFDEIDKQNKNKNKKIIFPEDWKIYNSLRFLQAKQYDIFKCIDVISDHLIWRKENIPLNITDKAMEIINNLGFIYIHGRDNKFRPTIVLIAKVYMDNKDKYAYENWVTALIYVLEYTINNLFLPGQVENWNIICDLANVSLFTLPSDFKRIFDTLQCNYRCRLYVMYILNMSYFIVFLWNIIKTMLDSTTEKKLKILSDTSQIFTYINEEQIEKKFGGKAENVTEDYFPPKMPSSNYLKKGDNLSELFVDEKKYRELVAKNSEYVKSPFLSFEKPIVKVKTPEKPNAKTLEKTIVKTPEKPTEKIFKNITFGDSPNSKNVDDRDEFRSINEGIDPEPMAVKNGFAGNIDNEYDLNKSESIYEVCDSIGQNGFTKESFKEENNTDNNNINDINDVNEFDENNKNTNDRKIMVEEIKHDNYEKQEYHNEHELKSDERTSDISKYSNKSKYYIIIIIYMI